jgi:hypothetical protein
MTSDKQAQANRRNALRSTGPKTPEGKAAVRHNATKHGLLSQEVLLPGEDAAALEELGERLRAELQPVGELEGLLVDRIIAAYWRLRRLGRVEAGIFAWELYGELAARVRQEARTYERQESVNDDFLSSLLPITKITDEKKHREDLYPGRRKSERFLQALPLRNGHRAKPLQGPTRTTTPPGRPERRR